MERTPTDTAGPDTHAGEHTPVLIAGLQLVLAEKRTALAVMRTGIAVFALPLGVLSLLVATSRYYEAARVLHLLVPLFVVCGGLLVLAVALVFRSFRRVRRLDRTIESFKSSDPTLARFMR
jgi:uncharacterized membrane protein YidH (DUF202 family)